jgi:hypothetical protein
MITLTIKKQDKSIYWIEQFNSQEEADSWLIEEKTRPYWDETYVCEFEDNKKELEKAKKAEAKKEAERQAKIASASEKLKALGITDEEISAIIGG